MYTMMTAVMTMATTSTRMTTMMGTVIWMACSVVRPELAGVAEKVVGLTEVGVVGGKE